MQPSYWEKFILFLKSCFTAKFKAFFPGFCMGLFGAKSLLFAGLSSELVTFGAYIVKFFLTGLMAISSGMGTTWGSEMVKRWMDQKKSPTLPVRKRKRA